MPARTYSLWVFVELVIALSLFWAVIGPFLYQRLLISLGWNTIGLELRWTIFVFLTFAGVAVISLLFFGAYKLFKPSSKN
jgi:hypothetical protein